MTKISVVVLGVFFTFLATSACHMLPGTEEYKLEQGKIAVGKILRDSESARYGDLKSFKVATKSGPDVAVCGKVNGKNASGAYVGFVDFVALLSDKSASIDPQTKVSKAAVDTAVGECKAAAKADDMGIGLAQFQCDLAKDAIDNWHQQEVFDTLKKEFCLVSVNS